jgi:hypothetical protein
MNSVAASNFYLYPDGSDIEQTQGWIYVANSNGGIITCPNGCVRQGGNGYAGQVALAPQVMGSNSYTVQARVHQFTSADVADVSVFGYLSSGNTYYRIAYDTAVGGFQFSKLSNGTNTVMGSVTLNIGNGNEALMRLKIQYVSSTSVLLSGYYSTNAGVTWTQIGTTYNDTSPLTPNGNVGIYTTGSNNQSDTTGLGIGDFIASTTTFWEGTVQKFTTTTNSSPAVLLSPAGINSSTPLPLVVKLHGSGASVIAGTATVTAA